MSNNNFFTQGQVDNLKEGEELFVTLMQKALSGKQSDFVLVKSWSERCVVREYIRGVKAVIQIFDNLFKSTYKTYLEQIDHNMQELGVVLALKQFYQCRNYYNKELAIAKDMLDEYRTYVLSGHIVDTLWGNERSEEDMVDYRTLSWRWF